MLEYHIEKCLRAGIAQYQADPGRFAHELMRFDDISAGEAEKLEQYLLSTPPEIIFQYPRETSKFPLLAITMSDAAEVEAPLGEQTNSLSASDAQTFGRHAVEGMSLYMVQMAYESSIYSFAKNPAVAIWYCRLAQMILMRSRSYLSKIGYVETDISYGDMVPEQGMDPGQFYVRELRLTASKFTYALDHLQVDADVQGTPIELPNLLTSMNLSIVDIGETEPTVIAAVNVTSDDD